MEEFWLLYRKIVNPNCLIRHIRISFGNVRDEIYKQYDLFADIEEIEIERKLQQTLVTIRNKFSKNSVLKFMEDYRNDIVIIFAGYSKEMEIFLDSNPGLRNRVPNKFIFEDYTIDELVEIGLLDLQK